MDRKRAYRYSKEIHEKLKAVNGRLLTPGYSREYVDFIKISVVGSYAKGKLLPNDLDLLIEFKEGGKYQSVEDGGILDKEYLRRYGMSHTINSGHIAFVWLTKGMRNVHRLSAEAEITEFDVKVEIYPNFNIA